MSENPTNDGQSAATENPPNDEQPKDQGFSQADVDKIVKERVARERAKFADYDDLKAKAGEKATVEERLAAMEKRATDAETRALRNDIATKHGISAEDRDLFLLGVDEETLTAQAERLAQRESERRRSNNVVPGAGRTPSSSQSSASEVARQLFGGE